jgi:ribosomal RNA-processing protein 12
MRKHVRNAPLRSWWEQLLPLARSLGNRAAQAGAVASRRAESVACRSLELQVWQCLPAFCRWPQDGAEALAGCMETLGNAFHKRGDLRTCIMVAMRTLAEQTRLALKVRLATLCRRT